jgi:F-type H+-transporting ATPase subunit a
LQDTTKKSDFDVTSLIMGHIKDSHVWHILDYTTTDENGEEHEVQVAVPLPMIVYANGHLDLFMSGAFDHGHKMVDKGENKYILVNDQIYLANDKGGITFENSEMDLHDGLAFLESNAGAEILNEKPLDFSITKNVASMMLASIILLIVFISFAKAYKKNPGSPKGMQAFLEPVFLYVRDDVIYPNLGEKTDKFLPYLMTVFFFILFNNILGLIPFFPGNANVTGNIAVTMVLALFTFFMINLNGNKDYWHHTFWMPGVPIFVKPILAVVELMGMIVKPVALMIRLFANISAGHIIILSLVSLIFIFGTVWISPVSIIFVLFMDCLEMLVAFLQAYIFTMLSAVFISLAVAEHKHE